MIFHFICTGNIYRSRLAEAYLNSLQIKNVAAISSGIKAVETNCGTVSWYAQRIFKNNDLFPFTKPTWTQTTPELLKSADVTVFIRQKHFDYCKENFGFDGNNSVVWDILDLDEMEFAAEAGTVEGDIERLKASEETYKKIRENIHELVKTYVPETDNHLPTHPQLTISEE